MNPVDIIMHLTQISNDHLNEAEANLAKANEILKDLGGKSNADYTTDHGAEHRPVVGQSSAA